VEDNGHADLLDTAQGDQTSGATENQDQATQIEKYIPFSSGKEKFKANGKEHEWDWETTKKYAQLGYAGQQAIERSATTEKKSREFMGRLQELAQTDPDGLIEVLTGKRRQAQPHAQAQEPRQAKQGHAESSQSEDPKDARIRELENKLNGVLERDEQAQVEAERTAFSKELDEATSKYPVLKEYGGLFTEIVKVQYRKHLNLALEARQEPPSVEDVAFYVSQQIQESRQKKDQEKQQRTEEKRKTAPLSGVPGGGGSSDKKGGREELLRAMGRM
jgi:hypothetical protein